MPTEIERKFLVIGDAWRHNAVGISYCQGYLSCDVSATVRVRITGKKRVLSKLFSEDEVQGASEQFTSKIESWKDSKACITVKGPIHGVSRAEFEYSIPVADAIEMQQLCKTPLVRKTRYRIPYENHTWEVDEFHGDNEGLIIAEVELDNESAKIKIPPWVGQEVSDDRRYCNSNLSVNPYKTWR